MAENTEIVWCDSTFNPWIGCTKVSPGCANCYAERDFDLRKHVAKWGPGQPRHRTSAAYWKQPLKWDRTEAGKTGTHAEFIAYRKPRVFCGSLCDWLDDEVPIAWLADLLDLIRRTPNLDWLLLTKRPQNWLGRIKAARNHLTMKNGETAVWLNDWLPGTAWYDGCGCAKTASGIIGDKVAVPPANVLIGWSIENQKANDERTPHGLAIPARGRFVSCEPLLGSVEFSDATHRSDCIAQLGKPALAGIHWVICGGESGPNARPMHPDWARSLRDQSVAAGVPFLFKQWGEWWPINQQDATFTARLYRSNRQAKLYESQAEIDELYGRTCTVPSCVMHLDGSVHDPIKPMAFLHGTGAMTSFKVGKRASGRLIDGREHNEFPEVRP